MLRKFCKCYDFNQTQNIVIAQWKSFNVADNFMDIYQLKCRENKNTILD